MVENIWIVGAGTAGTSAAIWARKENKKIEINLVGEEPFTEYSRCGLPYAISGEIPSFEKLVLHPESWYTKFIKANLFLSHRVESVDTKSQTLKIRNLKTNEVVEKTYEKLILATGSVPKVPPIKGIDNPNVFKVKTIDDAKRIKDIAEKKKNALIIGAGLIGLELAEALSSLGVRVIIVEYFPSVLPAMIDPDMGKVVMKKAEEREIEFYLNSIVTEIDERNGKLIVTIKERDSGRAKEVEVGFVIAATGMKPNVELAKQIGVEIGPYGGIKVNNRMETNIPNIYAAGDCVETINFITKKTFLSGLGTIAVRQGRVAGINAAGGNATFPDALASRVTKLFGLEIAATGLTSYIAEKEGFEIVSVRIKELDKEHYYPDKVENIVKLIADKKSGKVIGAQIIGRGATLRNDILTSLIYYNGEPSSIVDLETCYAPPVAPVWDPIAIAAMTLKEKLRRMREYEGT